MATHLGIDMGGTASRWVLIDDAETIVARGAAAGATGHLFNPVERERLHATLAAVAEGARAHAPDAAFLGITGLGDKVHGEARG